MFYLGSYFWFSDSPLESSCITQAIEGNRDTKFRFCRHGWREMVCANTVGYGISGRTDDFTHGVQQLRLKTKESGCCLQWALCRPEGMLSVEGLHLALMQMLGSGGLPPPFSLEAPGSLLWSLPSSTPNVQAPGISTEKGNWEFKPLQLSSWAGGDGCRMLSSKTYFPVSSQSIILSWNWAYYKQKKPRMTFWGHWEQLLLPQVLLVRLCIFTVIPLTEAAFALTFFLAPNTSCIISSLEDKTVRSS